jgi:tRNA-dihydrouridine synthase
MGGQPAGKVDRTEHGYADWERRVDAMGVLLSGTKGGKKLLTVDQRRRALETLTPEDYDRLRYYERWVIGLGQTLIQRGIITTAELAKKMLEVEKRG